MRALRLGNLALRFTLELSMLAAFAYWGLRLPVAGAARVALAVVAPLAVATVWGVLVAPRAARRLADPWRLVVEAALFGLAAVALAAVGATAAALALALAYALSLALMLAWDQRRVA